jgi:hypothetical protein
LLVLFSVATLIFRRREAQGCGCIGRVFDPHSKPKLVLRNIVLVAVSPVILTGASAPTDLVFHRLVPATFCVVILGAPSLKHLLLVWRASKAGALGPTIVS